MHTQRQEKGMDESRNTKSWEKIIQSFHKISATRINLVGFIGLFMMDNKHNHIVIKVLLSQRILILLTQTSAFVVIILLL